MIIMRLGYGRLCLHYDVAASPLLNQDERACVAGHCILLRKVHGVYLAPENAPVYLKLIYSFFRHLICASCSEQVSQSFMMCVREVNGSGFSTVGKFVTATFALWRHR